MYDASQSSPAIQWKAVTPSDSTVLAAGCRGLFVGTAGNVAVTGADGTSVTFLNVANGTKLDLGPVKVLSTGTTASNILALY